MNKKKSPFWGNLFSAKVVIRMDLDMVETLCAGGGGGGNKKAEEP